MIALEISTVCKGVIYVSQCFVNFIIVNVTLWHIMTSEEKKSERVRDSFQFFALLLVMNVKDRRDCDAVIYKILSNTEQYSSF